MSPQKVGMADGKQGGESMLLQFTKKEESEVVVFGVKYKGSTNLMQGWWSGSVRFVMNNTKEKIWSVVMLKYKSETEL